MKALASVGQLADWMDASLPSANPVHILRIDPLQEWTAFTGSRHFAVLAPSDGIPSVVFHGSDARDDSRRSSYFDWHQDGLYLDPPPEFVLLVCIAAGRRSARTRVTDLRRATKALRASGTALDADRLELRYIGRDEESHAHPLLRAPKDAPGKKTLTVGSRAALWPLPGRGHLLSLRRTSELGVALMHALDSNVVLDHVWRAGDCLLIDNRVSAHSRSAGPIDRERLLLRFWLSARGSLDQRPPVGSSMSAWAAAAATSSPKGMTFSARLVAEERGKLARLERETRDTGLPTYLSKSYEVRPGRGASAALTQLREEWSGHDLVAIRLNEAGTGRVLYRKVGIKVEEVLAVCRAVSTHCAVVVRIMEYAIPDYSGTLLVRADDVILEFVSGGHEQITTGRGQVVSRCSLGAMQTSVRYDLVPGIGRDIAFELLTTALRLCTGVTIRRVLELQTPVYAEFHWRHDTGMKFIEYSESEVWTSVGLRPDSQWNNTLPRTA